MDEIEYICRTHLHTQSMVSKEEKEDASGRQPLPLHHLRWDSKIKEEA